MMTTEERLNELNWKLRFIIMKHGLSTMEQKILVQAVQKIQTVINIRKKR